MSSDRSGKGEKTGRDHGDPTDGIPGLPGRGEDVESLIGRCGNRQMIANQGISADEI
jgi:hypothetical protein